MDWCELLHRQESRKLSRHLMQQDGWKLQIVKRRQRAFKITGPTWIVERSLAWLRRNRCLSKDYELRVQTSETLIDIAAVRLISTVMLSHNTLQTPSKAEVGVAV